MDNETGNLADGVPNQGYEVQLASPWLVITKYDKEKLHKDKIVIPKTSESNSGGKKMLILITLQRERNREVCSRKITKNIVMSLS